MAPGKYTRPLHQSIRGLICFSQLIPNTMSTSCNNLVTVKSKYDVTPANVIGAPCTIPRERALAPFPSSKKVSWDLHVNPAIVVHSGVTKQRVAPLSIKAVNNLPLIRAGTTSSMPSDSTRLIFLLIFASLVPTTTPVNLESSLDSCGFSSEFLKFSSLTSALARPRCRQLCKALKVVVNLEALPSSMGFNCLSNRPSISRFSLMTTRASLSFNRR